MKSWSQITPSTVFGSIVLSVVPAVTTAAFCEFGKHVSVHVHQGVDSISVSGKGWTGPLLYATNPDASQYMTSDGLVQRIQFGVTLWKETGERSDTNKCMAYAENLSRLMATAAISDGAKLMEINIENEVMKGLAESQASNPVALKRSLDDVSRGARRSIWSNRGVNDFFPWEALGFFVIGLGMVGASIHSRKQLLKNALSFTGGVCCLAAGFYSIRHIDNKMVNATFLQPPADLCQVAAQPPSHLVEKGGVGVFLEELPWWFGKTP